MANVKMHRATNSVTSFPTEPEPLLITQRTATKLISDEDVNFIAHKRITNICCIGAGYVVSCSV